MSIEKEYGKFIPVCDLCEEVLPAEDSYNEALHAIKEAGWNSSNKNGMWTNICKACAEEG